MAEPASWLTGEVVASFGELVRGARLGAPSLSGTVALVIPPAAGRPRRARPAAAAASAGAPTVQGTLRIEGGRVVGWAPGEADPGAAATLTLAAADALAVVRGDEEPSVLFMQGRLKVDGDMDAVLALLRATTTAAYGVGRATLEGSLPHG